MSIKRVHLTPIAVHAIHHVRSRCQYARSRSSLVAKLLLSLFDFINVCVAAKPFDDVACLAAKRYGQGAEPSIHPIVATDTELNLKIFAFSRGSFPLAQWRARGRPDAVVASHP